LEQSDKRRRILPRLFEALATPSHALRVARDSLGRRVRPGMAGLQRPTPLILPSADDRSGWATRFPRGCTPGWYVLPCQGKYKVTLQWARSADSALCLLYRRTCRSRVGNAAGATIGAAAVLPVGCIGIVGASFGTLCGFHVGVVEDLRIGREQ
jgi:hypothetical protein